MVPLYFCFCRLCFWCEIQKTVAETAVKQLTPCVLSWERYCSRSQVPLFHPFWVDFVFGVREGSGFILLHELFSLASTTDWREYPLPALCSRLLCRRLTGSLAWVSSRALFGCNGPCGSSAAGAIPFRLLIRSGTRKSDTSDFVLSRVCFDYSGSCGIPHKF